jgi:hypothetical protein
MAVYPSCAAKHTITTNIYIGENETIKNKEKMEEEVGEEEDSLQTKKSK